jgi:hypothetical protein
MTTTTYATPHLRDLREVLHDAIQQTQDAIRRTRELLRHSDRLLAPDDEAPARRHLPNGCNDLQLD